jgi:transcriptional regulator with XRE-family HTH domain
MADQSSPALVHLLCMPPTDLTSAALSNAISAVAASNLAGDSMITGAQMKAGRAMLGIDQRELAKLANVSLPTIQRMEASDGNVRGVIESLTKVVEAFDRAGIELISEYAPSAGSGRGVRLKQPKGHTKVKRAAKGPNLASRIIR